MCSKSLTPILGRDEASTFISFLPFTRLSLKQACEESDAVMSSLDSNVFFYRFEKSHVRMSKDELRLLAKRYPSKFKDLAKSTLTYSNYIKSI